MVTACGGVVPEPAVFTAPLPAVSATQPTVLVVVGDLQRTAPFLEFWREQNDAERTQVVDAIATTHPDLVAITGDCVFNGGSDAQWATFDALTAPLRAAGIPAVAAFGNHEYWSGRTPAEAHLFPRFPLDAGRHWFAMPLGPLRILVLDSNRGHLTPEEWTAQFRWYTRALTDYDADPTVRGVLVLMHHPPYTNSTVTGDTADVQEAFVPGFTHATKTLAMLTGHVHSYERFVRDGRTYVVSGGGGGPRARLALGTARRHPDDHYPGPALRDFNFTVYTVDARGVHAQVHGLARGASQWTVIDRFELPWPTPR